MNKEYYKNVLIDLKEFNGSSPSNWDDTENIAAELWRKRNPSSKKEFERYYQESKQYVEAIAIYNQTGKKRSLYSKIKKIIDNLGDVQSIIDYGCGVGSDSLELSSEGFKVTAMDLPSVMLKFAEFRIKKYGLNVKVIKVLKGNRIPKTDMILSLDVLEHIFNPYELLTEFFESHPKYILMTTAFGIHEQGGHTIPQHTDFKVAKIEEFMAENGYPKRKLDMLYPPRLFIRQKGSKCK
jgi:cyclopropane fatty-acyl-phospholipid synthase-like methyltransferase